jgi:hypothetical protein
MNAPVRLPSRGRGRLALALSLGLHLLVLAAVVRLAGRATPAPAPEARPPGGPAVPHLLLEEPREHELHGQLFAHTGPPARPRRPPAPETSQDVVAISARETIVPVTAPPEQPPAGVSVAPELVNPPPRPGDGTTAGGLAPGGTEGGGGGRGFFESGTPARSIVYVIDRSASMGRGGLLDAAVRELCASLSRLPPATRFQVVVYHDRPALLCPGPEELLPATAENTARAIGLLDDLDAEGGTNHLPALRLALSLAPEVIYLLTDADDLSHEHRLEATRLNAGRAVIHTIELSPANRGRADMPLQVLARENRGTYRAVDLRRQ